MMLANSFAPDAWLLLPHEWEILIAWLLAALERCKPFAELEEDAVFFYADPEHGFKRWQKMSGATAMALATDCDEGQEVIVEYFKPGTIVQESPE